MINTTVGPTAQQNAGGDLAGMPPVRTQRYQTQPHALWRRCTGTGATLSACAVRGRLPVSVRSRCQTSPAGSLRGAPSCRPSPPPTCAWRPWPAPVLSMLLLRALLPRPATLAEYLSAQVAADGEAVGKGRDVRLPRRSGAGHSSPLPVAAPVLLARSRSVPLNACALARTV